MSTSPTLILAPIRGITDDVYRTAFARCFGGFDYAIAPFIPLRQGHLSRPAELLQIALENNLAMKAIPQALTNHPQTFSAVLQQLSDAGHEEVNWNLGCPYPTVAGRGRGAGLLPQSDRIDAILDEVLNKSTVRLSVKMRLGYHDPDDYKAVREVLNRYPLKEVILHARTANQMYDGAVDVSRAGNMLSSCRHPFVYNGDITSLNGFRDLCRQLPYVKAWMIGRGALVCPFLPSQLKGNPLPVHDIRRQRLCEFHNYLLEGYKQRLSGPRHLKDKMLEQWKYLSLVFADPAPLLNRIRRSYTSRYEATVEWAFDQPLAEI